MDFNCVFMFNCTGVMKNISANYKKFVEAVKLLGEGIDFRWSDYKAPGTMVGLAMVDMNIEKYSAR